MSQQINLYNPLFLRKEKYFSARTMLQSIGLIVLGLAVLYAYALLQTRELERVSADYGRQLAAQRDQFIRLGGQGQSKLLEAEAARHEAGARCSRWCKAASSAMRRASRVISPPSRATPCAASGWPVC